MKNPQPSPASSSLLSKVLPREHGGLWSADNLFMPVVWAVGALALAYLYQMSSGPHVVGQESGLLCMVLDEILTVIAPTLTLEGING